jgi:Ni2+-binding GTPase involved in maturation of urease and hydrogenase
MARLVLVGGFLGAGKTTTLLRAVELLRAAGYKPALITNDQGTDLVDTAFARATGVDVAEVTSGCFCCRFDDLAETTARVIDEYGADIVLAEAVGSCTDLTATVLRPLAAERPGLVTLAPLTVVVGAERYLAMLDSVTDDPVSYLFRKQCEEASVLVLNKVDLLDEYSLDELRHVVATEFPNARLLETSARTGEGLADLIAQWVSEDSTFSPSSPVLDIDYDVYAEAEARLGWVNGAGDVVSAGSFDPVAWVDAFCAAVNRRLAESGALVGHIKVQVNSDAGVTKASVVSRGAMPQYEGSSPESVQGGALLLNLRVESEPDQLERYVLESLALADAQTGTTSGLSSWQCFAPARPQPTHRMAL